jgi:hypothetical protein
MKMLSQGSWQPNVEAGEELYEEDFVVIREDGKAYRIKYRGENTGLVWARMGGVYNLSDPPVFEICLTENKNAGGAA